MSNNEEKEIVTLIDRFGVGLLSAVCCLLTYSVCFILLLVITQGFTITLFSGKVLIFLTISFFILGFVTLDNYFIKLITPIWKFIDEIFKN